MKKDFSKIECKECGAKVHVLPVHLENECIGVKAYTEKYPEAPLFSEAAKRLLEQKQNIVNNVKVEFNIEKTFGVKLNDKVNTVPGFETAFPTTPVVDEHYVFNKSLLASVLFAVTTPGEKMLLTGATGTGKSSVVEQVAARLNLPFYRVNMDAHMTRSDFVGQWILEGKEMTFQYGILPTAMKEGAVLLLDEWDAGSPEVMLALQAVLDGGRLTITENGETVEPHPDFRIFATGNTTGQGDETGLYNGTQPQNFATLNRFTLVEEVDYMPKEQEKKVVKLKTGITDGDFLEKIVEVARLIRKAHVRGEMFAVMSTRNVVNIAKKVLAFGDIKKAYQVGFMNVLNTEDKAFTEEVIQRVWGV